MDRNLKITEHNSDPISDATQRLERNPHDVLALIDRANAFLEQRNAKAALCDIERSLELALMEPRLEGEIRSVLLAKLYTMQSRALAGLDDWATALLATEQAIREKVDSIDAIVQRGRCRRELGDLQGAFKDFDQALALNKYSAAAYVGRGISHYMTKDYQGAIADYDQAISLNETLAVAWSNRGNTYFALQDYQKAEQDCRTALKLDPRLIRAYEIISHIYQQQSRHSEALRILTEGLKHQPDEIRLLIQVVRIYSDREDLSEALSAANKILQQTTDRGEAYALRGQIHVRLGNHTAAIEDLERAIELEPTSVESHFNLALAYLCSENLAAAIDSLEYGLKLDPNDGQVCALYERLIHEQSTAEIYRAMGKYEAALKEWEQEIVAARKSRYFHKETSLLILAGSYYVKIGQHKKGVEHLWHGLRQAQRIGNRRLEAQANVELGYVAYEYTQPDKALECFQKVIHIGREIGDQHYEHIGLGNVGGMLAKTDRWKEGIDMLKEACKIAHEVGETRDEAIHCRNLGTVLVDHLRPLEGLEALERVQQIYQEEGLPNDETVDKLVHGIREILNRG
jgi:tetratricopeptide (TPR) repeat protein